jgi:hypothetical protein
VGGGGGPGHRGVPIRADVREIPIDRDTERHRRGEGGRGRGGIEHELAHVIGSPALLSIPPLL